MLDDYFRQYGLIAIFTALAVAVPTGMLIASWVLAFMKIRPSVPTFVKRSVYECGFETLSGKWSRFNFKTILQTRRQCFRGPWYPIQY